MNAESKGNWGKSLIGRRVVVLLVWLPVAISFVYIPLFGLPSWSVYIVSALLVCAMWVTGVHLTLRWNGPERAQHLAPRMAAALGVGYVTGVILINTGTVGDTVGDGLSILAYIFLLLVGLFILGRWVKRKVSSG